MPTNGKFLCVHKRHLQDESFSVNDAFVLALILDWQGRKGYCWGTNKQIGNALGLSVRTVGQSIRKLHDGDIIRILNSDEGRWIIPWKDVNHEGVVIRSGGFVMVPWAVFNVEGLTVSEVLVYCEVTSKAKQGYCYARNKVLAEVLGISDSKIECALKILERLGFIRRENDNRMAEKYKGRRIYIIQTPSKFLDDDVEFEAA
jgi:hypothetical protein